MSREVTLAVVQMSMSADVGANVDKALARVMTAVLKDGTELFKQFMDNESFRRWLTDTVFGITHPAQVLRAVCPP